jgi:uncharacterized Zn finger protein
MCKHVAATLYGVGARLDTAPELLFTLRNVDHLDLISQAVAAENLDATLAAGHDGALAEDDLGELFGIEMDSSGTANKPSGRKRLATSRSAPSRGRKSKSLPKKATRSEAKPGSGKATERSSAVASAKRKPGAVGPTRKRNAR